MYLIVQCYTKEKEINACPRDWWGLISFTQANVILVAIFSPIGVLSYIYSLTNSTKQLGYHPLKRNHSLGWGKGKSTWSWQINVERPAKSKFCTLNKPGKCADLHSYTLNLLPLLYCYLLCGNISFSFLQFFFLTMDEDNIVAVVIFILCLSFKELEAAYIFPPQPPAILLS